MLIGLSACDTKYLSDTTHTKPIKPRKIEEKSQESLPTVEKLKISNKKMKLTILYSKKASSAEYQIKLELIPSILMLIKNHKQPTKTIFLCLSDYFILFLIIIIFYKMLFTC